MASNKEIADQLRVLTCQVEDEEVSLREFAHRVRESTAALERVPPTMIRAAQQLFNELEETANAHENGAVVDVEAVVDRLLDWLVDVPGT